MILARLQESRGSVAVRMALGETQIVQETRQFLLDNKVSLDSFSQVGLCVLHTTDQLIGGGGNTWCCL